MILLVAQPGIVRENLLAALRQTVGGRISVLDSFSAEGAEDIPADLIIASARIEAIPVRKFLKRILDSGKILPYVILDARKQEEEDLYLAGAILVAGELFFPASIALHIRAFLKALKERKIIEEIDMETDSPDRFIVGQVQVDADRRTVTNIDSPKKTKRVPRLSLDLLRLFAETADQILTYEEITKIVWKQEFDGNNAAIREAVSSLRALLSSIGYDLNQNLSTEYGEGYIFHSSPIDAR